MDLAGTNASNKQGVDERADQNAYGISRSIGPRKSGAKNQVTDRCTPNFVEPRRLIKLRKLDGTRDGKSENRKVGS